MEIPRHLYPFDGHYLNLNGLRYHYLDEGSGDPVVMLHGNPTWSFYYRELVKVLRGSYRAIVPDHMGCGFSDKPDDRHYHYTLPRRVDDLESLLRRLGIHENITLILHDWGGMIGMAYAVRHPESIGRLVILNTAAFHKPDTKTFPWLLWLSRDLGLGALLIRKFNAFSRVAARLCCRRKPMDREIRKAYCAPYEENSIATLRFVQDIPLRPGDKSYDLVTEVQEKLSIFRHLPVLICWGDKDFVFDKHFLKVWIDTFPHAQVNRFPDCGHYVLEDATEEITTLIQIFLKRHPKKTIMTKPDFVNIASFLPVMAEKQPHEKAIIVPRGREREGGPIYTYYTFDQLNRESDCIARGLEEVGIGRGVRTALMVGPSLEFFALTFAIFKAGAVPVVIDPGIGIKNLKKCLAQAEPEAFIGVPKAHLARILFGWAKETIRTNITVGRRLFWGGLTLSQIKKRGQSNTPYDMAQTEGSEMAAILFTSGGTGTPKGAIYTHANFAAQVEIIRNTYNIVPGEVDLATFPLFALFDPALGMTTVVPDMDPTRPAHVEPEKIIDAVTDFDITNMFGSPALINRVGRYGAGHGVKLPTLRHVIAAGAPMPPAVLERFCTMLSPDSQVFTGFGATESMPVCSIGSHEILGETRHGTDEGKGVCVGRPVEDVTVSVIKITDTPIPQWDDSLRLATNEIGEITVKGPVVTRAYYKKEEATSLAKIYEPDGTGFWHRMGDLGFSDEKGRLWFCGRKSQRVITESGTLFTIPSEGVFNTHPHVYRTALTGVHVHGSVQPVLCVELEEGSRGADKEKVKQELLELGASKPHTKDIKTILFHDSFPVDIRHNAKIFRDKLGVWAQKKLT